MKAVGLLCLAAMLFAMPVAADECFSGKPVKLSYSDGRAITIIQRHGDDLTYTEPYEGFQDLVAKTHLMLFPKTSRYGARSTEFRWSSTLPRVSQMVPGYHFDLKGTMQSGTGKALPYRSVGDVLNNGVVRIGSCAYEVVVVKSTTYLAGAAVSNATDYLSADLQIVLRSEVEPSNGGRKAIRAVVAIQ